MQNLYIKRLRTQETKRLTTTEFVIGRNADADFFIRGNQMISRLAAKIHYSNGKYYIQDVGALNGIFVQDARLPRQSKAEITEGMTIQLADEKFTLFVDIQADIQIDTQIDAQIQIEKKRKLCTHKWESAMVNSERIWFVCKKCGERKEEWR